VRLYSLSASTNAEAASKKSQRWAMSFCNRSLAEVIVACASLTSSSSRKCGPVCAVVDAENDTFRREVGFQG
jgi:hypothetical protein